MSRPPPERPDRPRDYPVYDGDELTEESPSQPGGPMGTLERIVRDVVDQGAEQAQIYHALMLLAEEIRKLSMLPRAKTLEQQEARARRILDLRTRFQDMAHRAVGAGIVEASVIGLVLPSRAQIEPPAPPRARRTIAPREGHPRPNNHHVLAGYVQEAAPETWNLIEDSDVGDTVVPVDSLGSGRNGDTVPAPIEPAPDATRVHGSAPTPVRRRSYNTAPQPPEVDTVEIPSRPPYLQPRRGQHPPHLRMKFRELFAAVGNLFRPEPPDSDWKDE